MDIRFQNLGKGSVRLDAVIIPTIQGVPLPQGKQLGEVLAWLEDSGAVMDHSGKPGVITVCYGPQTAQIPRVVLVGMGQAKDFLPDAFRKAVASGMRTCRSLNLSRIGFLLEDLAVRAETLGKSTPDLLREAVFAAILSVYSCTEFRSEKARTKGMKDKTPEFFMPTSFVILHEGKAVPASLRLPVKLAEAEASAVCLARDLVNAPANIITPLRLADIAVALAKRHRFGCRVLSGTEMTRLGMGALLSVNDGSDKDARFIVLEYSPAGGKKRAPLVLVGKGITFDTGGISLKPSAGMHHMKGDMAGAAAVLGTFEAIGRIPESFSCPVVGLIPCTENMPGGNATRPGDIVASMSGKTVEILNTDAEGRLILCDALTYAQENWKPLAMVDIATLTGACAVALGSGAAGLFTDNEALRDTLMEVGNSGGDRFWPMPLWGHLREGLKSSVADIANVGPREGGAISAAMFLKEFVGEAVPWAHIDMAGAAISEAETPLSPKGATGFGVRTLISLARCVSEKMFRQS